MQNFETERHNVQQLPLYTPGLQKSLREENGGIRALLHEQLQWNTTEIPETSISIQRPKTYQMNSFTLKIKTELELAKLS